MNQLLEFVWTFHGVMEAVGLGLLLLIGLILGILLLVQLIKDKLK